MTFSYTESGFLVILEPGEEAVDRRVRLAGTL